jgi:hypothetical protein
MGYDYDILFQKNLESLREEILAYRNEEDLWKLHGDIKNTPANLALHICGNLKHFLGATLGSTGYVRDRDNEFSVKDVPRDEIIMEIDSTIETITPILKNLSAEDLNNTFPLDNFGEGRTIGGVITFLIFHLGYHLGQINYHRRIFNY